MAQTVNLITGMAAPAQADPSFLKRDQSQLAIEEFASIMNQNAQSFLNAKTNFQTRSDSMADDIFGVGDTENSAQKDCAKLSQGKRTIAQTKPEEVDASDYAGKVSELAEKVENAVQETMQVSEEDMEHAMEVLGLSPLDLLNPQNLIGLLQQLTGSEDVSVLLTSENFQLTMQEVTGLIAAFQQENGLSAVQFTDLLEQLSAEIDHLEEALQESLNADQIQPEQIAGLPDQMPEEMAIEADALETETVTQAPQSETQSAAAATPQNAGVQTQTSVDTEEPLEEQEIVQPEQKVSEQSEQADSGETNTSSQSGKDEKTFADSMEDQTNHAAEHANMFRDANVAVNGQLSAQGAEVPQAFSYLEVEQLMDQMEGLARAFSSAEGTTLEMQLNPESLGKLFLTVTEKHGALTAQIAASNEQVKEALQTQMVELRATLQTQGLKVEAVEVTVATHEFEQNLDGNTSANTGMQEQDGRHMSEQQNGRRNLDRNSLDELSGLMSEEETLVAQMMRDNGGTVDYTA